MYISTIELEISRIELEISLIRIRDISNSIVDMYISAIQFELYGVICGFNWSGDFKPMKSI
jgi:hypothetical protein